MGISIKVTYLESMQPIKFAKPQAREYYSLWENEGEKSTNLMSKLQIPK